MQKSCRAVQLLLGAKLDSMQCPLTEPRAWEDLWSAHPQQWLALLKLTTRTAADDPWAAGKVVEEAGLAKWTCRAGAATVHDEFMSC